MVVLPAGVPVERSPPDEERDAAREGLAWTRADSRPFPVATTVVGAVVKSWKRVFGPLRQLSSVG
ncbi:hypothetical protein IL38_22795 [Actinopolyspora erythraea]|uniref:Uncharacterized protein n=1 Tax=Actinopolyspora erythraea TaxID=414996 RepID=A0ABR4WZA0_9ACTN|nr:hypothetical protein IL38_22795 [Actinopolyspora erythraea]